MSSKNRAFIAVHIAVLTVSDSRTKANDKSGDLLVSRLTNTGHVLADRKIVKDDIGQIRGVVSRWVDDAGIQVAITTGGTGLTGRDVTPEAFQVVYEKEIPGFGELFRMLSFRKIGTSTIQSRAASST